MSRLHNELQALKTKFENVEKRLMSAGTEVVHLRQQHSDAQGNIASLRATVSPHLPHTACTNVSAQ